MAGVESTGFVIKTLQEIQSEIGVDLRANVANDLNLEATSLAGNIVGIFSARERTIWEEMQKVYNSQDPDSATGVSLDNIAAITGTVRKAAAKSTYTVRLNIDAGQTVPAGSVIAEDLGGGTPSQTVRFQTTAPVTNGGGGAADFDLVMEAVATGPIEVDATLPHTAAIITAVTGWNSAIFQASPTPFIGNDDETDADLRQRREDELRSQGSSSVEGVLSDVQAVTGVTKALVVENTTLATVDSIPGKAIEALVKGAADADLAKAIWESKAAGIETYGTTTQVHVDTQGISHDIKFTRPTDVVLYVEITATKTADYPTNGDDLVKAAVKAYGDGLDIGGDVISNQVLAASITATTGINVTTIKIDNIPVPVATGDYAIGSRELADIQLANITIV